MSNKKSKMKTNISKSNTKEKKSKKSHSVLDTLPWRMVDMGSLVGNSQVVQESNDDSGVLCLEELDANSYDVVDGQLVLKNPDGSTQVLKRDRDDSDDEEELADSSSKSKQKAKKQKKTKSIKAKEAISTESMSKVVKNEPSEETIHSEMSSWSEYGLDIRILRGLHKLGFFVPTGIQTMCLPRALRDGCDIFGAAETGSGKTLAFGLPILNSLIDSKPISDGVLALILTPTRELAVQVGKHLKAVLDGATNHEIHLGVLVGGMSMDRQNRILNQKPQIVIATPGRFWALFQEGHSHLQQLGSHLRFLVVDEADRMFDKGHFPELRPLIQELAKSKNEEKAKHAKRQTFLFSATMMLDQVQVAKTPKKKKSSKKDTANGGEPLHPLLQLMQQIGLRGKPAKCIVQTSDPRNPPEGGGGEAPSTAVSLPESLRLCAHQCIEKDKELYLYYFLLNYRGRALIFVNTISTLRRLGGILSLLKVPNVTTLHANMQQKQRLKHLEKFTADPHGVLVASDVAARGLDIPGIDFVIHYNIPKRTDTFVHRSGRTARASAAGFCLSLVAPTELEDFSEISNTIGVDRFVEFPVYSTYAKDLKERITLAKRVYLLESKKKSREADRNWYAQYAKAADIMLDDDEYDNRGNEDDGPTGHEKEAVSIRKRLDLLLQSNVVEMGKSRSFISHNLLRDDDTTVDALGQVGSKNALADVSRKGKRLKMQKVKTKTRR